MHNYKVGIVGYGVAPWPDKDPVKSCKRADEAARIESASRRMASLSDAFHEVARLQTGAPRALALVELAADDREALAGVRAGLAA